MQWLLRHHFAVPLVAFIVIWTAVARVGSSADWSKDTLSAIFLLLLSAGAIVRVLMKELHENRGRHLSRS